MSYRAVFSAIASPVAPVSPTNYVADVGHQWLANSSTIGRVRTVPKSYLIDGISGVSGLVSSVQFEGASAFFLLPQEIESAGLIIKGPPSLPHKIFVNGVESNVVVAGATVEIRADSKTDITQSEYPITVGLNTVIAYADTTPNAFSLQDMFGCAIGSEHTTETITPTGFDNAVVSGTEYALIDGVRTELPVNILEGSSVAFIFTQNQLEDSHIVSIGNASAQFTSFRDRPAVLTPVSLFHIAYARAGVTYTSGLIRNDTGNEVELSVSGGLVVGNKTTLADGETCELEFTAPAANGHYDVVLSSGRASVTWRVWRDAEYLDPWISYAGTPGVLTESQPLSFVSLPKPARMSLYVPSGVDAKVNGIDINANENYAGVDASATELEITTNDVVTISAYPNFAAKRVRVGSVYATWLLFPTGGDPNGEVPYYDVAFLQDTVPVVLRSVTYSSKLDMFVDRQDQVHRQVESSGAARQAAWYDGKLSVRLGITSAATANQELVAAHATRTPDASISLEAVAVESSEALNVVGSPTHAQQFHERVRQGQPIHTAPYLGRANAADGEYVNQAQRRSAAPDSHYPRTEFLFGQVAEASHAFKHGLREALKDFLNVNSMVLGFASSSARQDRSEVHGVDGAAAEWDAQVQYLVPSDAVNYSAAFFGVVAEAISSGYLTHQVESTAERKEVDYNHISGTLRLKFVKAESLYSVPMAELSKTESWHSKNSVSHWQTNAYNSAQSEAMYVEQTVYGLSLQGRAVETSDYQSMLEAMSSGVDLNRVPMSAHNVAYSDSAARSESRHRQQHFDVVASRSKLISLASNLAALTPSLLVDAHYTVESLARNVSVSNSGKTAVSANRRQEVHSVYMPEYAVFDSFFVDESERDTAHGYFKSNVNALSDGMYRWHKNPYEIAPYELQPNVWVWITPVYGFDLCSAVDISGYIRGG